MIRRITAKQVAAVLVAILNKQEGKQCPLCKGSLRTGSKKQPVLDHDHQTGYLRGVLCRNCNGIEGKVFNLARRAKGDLTPQQWIENWLAYHRLHETPQHGGILHPTHKTPEEKRLERNRKARLARAKAKSKG